MELYRFGAEDSGFRVDSVFLVLGSEVSGSWCRVLKVRIRDFGQELV